LTPSIEGGFRSNISSAPPPRSLRPGGPKSLEETSRPPSDAFGYGADDMTALDVAVIAYRTRGEDHTAWTAESSLDSCSMSVRAIRWTLQCVCKNPTRFRAALDAARHFNIKGVPADEKRQRRGRSTQCEPPSTRQRLATVQCRFGDSIAMLVLVVATTKGTALSLAYEPDRRQFHTGEGGEEVSLQAVPNGDSILLWRSSRFLLTLRCHHRKYLVHADMMHIKMAQGAKPGRSAVNCPAHKGRRHVIARVIHSTPGVGLISPPPHHDTIRSRTGAADLRFEERNPYGLGS